MKKKWKFYDHTADLKFVAFGKTLEEAFSNAAPAMFDYLIPVEQIRPLEKRRVEKKTNSLEKLLFDYLDELLYFLDTEGLLVCEIQELKIEKNATDYHLSAVAVGDFAEHYKTGGDIKAITYHEMKITQTSKGYEIQVVVDI
ncbi:MAG: archease [Planctomycetota bacterium]